MVNVRDILSTVVDTQYHGGHHNAHGGYHEYSGERIVLLFEYLQGTEHHHSTHNILHVHHDILHGTEYPLWYLKYPQHLS